MKTLSSQTIASAAARGCERAFTLAEVLTTTGVLVLLMAGIISGYVFGIKMFQITKAKLGATDDARKAFIRLTDEIRSANQVSIGTYNGSQFVGDGTNALQSGYALAVYPDTNHVNNYIWYFFSTNLADPANYNRLLRTTNGVNFTPVTTDQLFSNNVPIFTSEDSYGNILTSNQNNRVIGVTLQFHQATPVQIGTNSYDFYQLRSRITRRVF
jgi:hypothetical protein